MAKLPMHILNVNMSIDPMTGGGTAERTVQMARHFSKSGFRSSILTSDNGITCELLERLQGVKVNTLPCLLHRFHIPRFNYQKLIKVVSSCDIVHLMNHWTAINAIIYKICTKIGKPYVVCPAGALSIFGRSKLLKKTYNALIGSQIIRNASGHISITAEEAYQYRDYGIDPRAVTIIPNGIVPQEFKEKNDTQFRTRHGLENNPLVLFMGRLNTIKGPDLLLHAFAGISEIFPTHRLVFAGPDGGMLSELKDMAQNYKIADRTHFIGYIGGEEKSWAYHAAELLVIPSRQEAMSIVAIEAGITGTPILMTDVCGINEINEIGGGIVVKPKIESIQDGLSILRNAEELKTMGSNLKQFVLDYFTWDSVIKKYISLFEKVLS